MNITVANPTLYCPIRGTLKTKAKAKDGLTFTEEKLRIDCIKHLLSLGYPKDRIQTETVILRFGHKGTNSLRTDIVVYDRPTIEIARLTADQVRQHILIIAEIKRDNKSAQSAKDEQLIPALGLVPRDSVLGIYWDDVEQAVFYKEVTAGLTQVREASLSHLPRFGSSFAVKQIHHSDLRPSHDLVKIFRRFNNVLHQAGHELDERYELLLQIILIKIYDEQGSRLKDSALIIQDFSSMSMSDKDILVELNTALEMSLVLYQKHLVKPIEKKLRAKADTLRNICRALSHINLLDSSPQVMQDFYMYFSHHIYKVDLAQYFTPYEIVDFIVRITNPRFGDSVKDPACGSADFLVAAYRIARERHGAEIADQVYGTDSGARAVQISVLNMILNGDGKSHIAKGDSLEEIEKHTDAHTLMLCNPPFGKDILEERPPVLAKFELARDAVTGKPFAEQETGILFVEVCVRSARPGQRIAIILPNGYLGNRSERYLAMRRWLLQRVRIAAVIGFPRFTFKKSGADVSASVIIMEKRDAPIADPTEMADYPIHFNLLNKVGWDVSNKRAERVYQASEVDGAHILDKDNNRIPDADFDRVLSELYASPVVDAFPWITHGIPGAGANDGWAVPASNVLVDGPRRSVPAQSVQ
jgi:type I restriction enzyme M protein